MRNRSTQVLVSAVLFLSSGGVPCAGEGPPTEHRRTILSKPLPVEGIIKSMEGPYDMAEVTLGAEGDAVELLWITGFRSEIVQDDGETPANPEFMCHTNLDFYPRRYWRRLLAPQEEPRPMATSRMFTLSQGAFAVRLPDGFGYPITSDQPLHLFTQVLNHNEKDLKTSVRHKVTITYVRDAELTGPMIPLFSAAPQGLKLLSGDAGYWNVAEPDESKHGPSCLPGTAASSSFPSSTKKDKLGREFTGHWNVEPGVEENHTNVTDLLRLPYDTTFHYANVHLHPFAEYIELRDITEGKTVFRSEVRTPDGRIGITHVDEFSSREGLPLYRDHEYEIVSRYNNTSGVQQDAMATIMIYVRDRGFDASRLGLPGTPRNGEAKAIP